MKTDAERLVESLLQRYVVRPHFVTEVRPLVDKIFAEEFPVRDREGLVRLVEDAFRREAENFATHSAGIAALEKLQSGMQQHVEVLQELSRKVQILTRYLTNLRKVSLN